ncbi:MAG: hypothetical protein QW520_03445 [Methanomassiliicoccales archaeon]
MDYQYLAEVCLSIPLQDIFDLFHEDVLEEHSLAEPLQFELFFAP